MRFGVLGGIYHQEPALRLLYSLCTDVYRGVAIGINKEGLKAVYSTSRQTTVTE